MLFNKNNNKSSITMRKKKVSSTKTSIKSKISILKFLLCFFTLIYMITIYQHSSSWTTTTSLSTSSSSIGVQQQQQQQREGDNTNCCSLAYTQSYGFFTDITDAEWKRKQWLYSKSFPHNVRGSRPVIFRRKVQNGGDNGSWFYMNNYEPNFSCNLERRIGDLGDGGKWVCDPHRIKSSKSSTSSPESNNKNNDDDFCLVYSIGSNGDANFEQHIHNALVDDNVIMKNGEGSSCGTGKGEENKKLQIHTFDLKEWNKRNGLFADAVSKAGGTFHHWGILSHEGMNMTNPDTYKLPKVFLTSPFKTFDTTFHELNHSNRWIDIMKIDCEGCEWESLQYWLKDWKKNNIMVRQILIELHNSPLPEALDFFNLLEKEGYVIFHKENIGAAAEYGFLKLHPDFFQK